MLALSGCDQLDTPKNAQGSGALDRAQSYLDQGQYRAASIEARKALQEDGSNVEAHILLSRILMDVGQGKSAIIQLEQLSPAEAKYLLIEDLPLEHSEPCLPSPRRSLHDRLVEPTGFSIK